MQSYADWMPVLIADIGRLDLATANSRFGSVFPLQRPLKEPHRRVTDVSW